jgi:transcriptional regulator with XRE-family HTH domain
VDSPAPDDETADGDWVAVAEALKARMAVLRLKQLDLAHRAGVSPATIREITNSPRPRRRYGRTLAALSEALDWPADHLDAVLTGRDTATTPERDDPQVLDELLAIRQELQAIKQRLDALERDRPPAQ